jgi:hypothetical protein
VREGEGGEVGHEGRWARLGRGEKEKNRSERREVGCTRLMGWRPGVVWVGREKRSGPILGRKREREKEREREREGFPNF